MGLVGCPGPAAAAANLEALPPTRGDASVAGAMRILIVTEDVPAAILGGAGKHAVVLANALLDIGHEVEMLGQVRSGDPEMVANNGFRGVLHTRIDFSGTGWKEHKLGVFLSMRRSHIARRIAQAIRSLGDGWDVVHYHGHYPMVGLKVPGAMNFVHTMHDQGAECMIKTRFRYGQPCKAIDPMACAECATPRPNMLQKMVSARTVRLHRAASADAFRIHKAIFVADFMARRFEDVACEDRPMRLHVVHNFVGSMPYVETPAGRASASDGTLPRRKPIVFMAGRVDQSKGFGALFEALADERLAALDLRLAGDGPNLPELRARHAARGVAFLGWQTSESVVEQTMNADICVVPSVCEEACATTVLEALTLCKPTFALARGGTPALTRYERYPGQLHLFSDVSALANALVPEFLWQLQRSAECAPSADVHSRLPEILDVYKLGLRTASGIEAT